ncbi:MAG: response regulator transcription factor [Anaerolineales bacterium]|nr:response regulator transcription factor [Anaerolineales bacterium]
MTKPLALIVEDHPMLRTFFAEALQEANYQTEVAQDGNEALNKLGKLIPDLVLLDLHLPHISGEDILTAIRIDCRLKETKVIVTSVDGSWASFLENKADLVLTKPVGYKQLQRLASRMHPNTP